MRSHCGRGHGIGIIHLCQTLGHRRTLAGCSRSGVWPDLKDFDLVSLCSFDCTFTKSCPIGRGMSCWIQSCCSGAAAQGADACVIVSLARVGMAVTAWALPSDRSHPLSCRTATVHWHGHLGILVQWLQSTMLCQIRTIMSSNLRLSPALDFAEA